MRIFALETDPRKIVRRFCNEGEQVILTTYYHGLAFFFAILREIFLTIILAGLGIVAWYVDRPMGPVTGVLFLVWFVLVFFNILKAYLDWFFDSLIVTTDKVILVDQSSIFRHTIKPIHAENIGGITAATQFWGLFRFGAITIHLKEGLGGDSVTLKYVPHYQDVASKISDAVTRYQRHGAGQTAAAPETKNGQEQQRK